MSSTSKIPADLKRSEPHAFHPATDIPFQAERVILSISAPPFQPTHHTTAVRLVTGATAGKTVPEFAKHGPAQIWVSGRSEKGVIGEVKSVGWDVDVKFLPMDVGNSGSMKNAA
jgi:hypothetical protein